MTYAAARSFLYGLERRGVRLGLDRIVGAFRDLGDPQESFPAILVGGTNGKGSVTAFCAAGLQAAGHRTGLFTSPHLIDFRERMRVDGRMITEAEVVDLVARLRGIIDRWELSFFEATTLLAFQWFKERGVTAASVEVGLGGRLDASRPVAAAVTVVTTISLDHMKILGPDRATIAGEKAGIFRAGVPVACGVWPHDAVAVLERRAREAQAPFLERRRLLHVDRIRVEPGRTSFRLAARRRDDGSISLPAEPLDLEITLAGRHQAANAALAALALAALPAEMGVGPPAIVRGLRAARWSGRCERLAAHPRVLVDVGHNMEGARSLARTLRALRETDVVLVAGMVEGKEHRAFLRHLLPLARTLHFCTPDNDRAVDGSVMAEAAESLGRTGTTHPRPADAIDAAMHETGTILVTGSFYTVGSVMEHLGVGPSDPLWEMGGA